MAIWAFEKPYIFVQGFLAVLEDLEHCASFTKK